MDNLKRTQNLIFTITLSLIAILILGVTGAVASAVPVITSPADHAITNSPVISGTADPGALITLFLDTQRVNDTVYADSLGKWDITTAPSVGTHNVYVQSTVDQVYESTSSTISFTFDNIRPIIANNVAPANDMTKVPVSSTVYFEIQDNQGFDSKLTAVDNPVTVTAGGTQVPGTATYTQLSATRYRIIFRPTESLQPNREYKVSVSPQLPDEAGNFAFPKTWKFTTAGTGGTVDPHGNYTNNVNMCADCHSTHNGKDAGLTPQKYAQNIEDYCNACHDGTGAPVPPNWLAGHRHNFASADKAVSSNACADCHDPHLTWTDSNPAMFKGYYSHEHNDPTNPSLPTTSEQKLCETCHSPAIYGDSSVTYIQRQYKKWDTATGKAEDYSLCQRCHDGSQAVNVAVYYNNVNSGHYFSATDGSPLNGAMPCAECHESHGSTNLKLLRSSLGDGGGTSFSFTSGSWDASTERKFCTSCHDNNTVLYGRKAALVLTIDGHQSSDGRACNSCHGGNPIAAAHGPAKRP